MSFLTLQNIRKSYGEGENQVEVLKGISQLSTGSKSLSDGMKEYTEGISAAYEGTKALNDGIGALWEAGNAMSEGYDEILDGVLSLKDGVKKFNDEGIREITRMGGEDLQQLLTRVRALRTADLDYDTYSGKTAVLKAVYVSLSRQMRSGNKQTAGQKVRKAKNRIRAEKMRRDI